MARTFVISITERVTVWCCAVGWC